VAAPAQEDGDSLSSASPAELPTPHRQVVEPQIPANYDAVLAADAPPDVAVNVLPVVAAR
jgi:hypothetical protein